MKFLKVIFLLRIFKIKNFIVLYTIFNKIPIIIIISSKFSKYNYCSFFCSHSNFDRKILFHLKIKFYYISYELTSEMNLKKFPNFKSNLLKESKISQD